MSTSNAVSAKHPVDEIPRLDRLFPLGLQHVLAMYAGAIAVPLIVGGALGYSSEDIAHPASLGQPRACPLA
ncbi:solute carrier family 23 protein [Georgenia sp. SUBG003]|uniref:solute carrier family 23 protein n=1 Tax=Georgenia sp. SUBG003 TaxID=1497974 RepID=UPI003AB3110B